MAISLKFTASFLEPTRPQPERSNESQPFGHLSEIAHLGPALCGCTDAKADPLCPVADPGVHIRAGGEVVLC